MNRITHSIKNSLWGIIYRVLHMIIPVVFRAIIIKSLGVAYIGLDGLFKSILNVLTLTELGFGTAVIYMMYKPIAEEDYKTINRLLALLKRVYKWIGALVLLVGVILIPFLRFLVKNDTGVEVNIYLLYSMYLFHTVLSYWMYAYRSTLFAAHQEYEITYKILVVCSVVQYIIQAVVLYCFKNYYLYLAVFALMIIPENILYKVFSEKRYTNARCEGEPTKEEIETIKIKIGALLGHRIGNTVIFSIDNIIISAYIGVSILAKYDNYNLILLSLVSLLSVIYSGIMASVGNKIQLDTTEDIYSLFKRLTFLWNGLIGWATACLLALYQPFIALWVGEGMLFSESIVICISLYFFVWQFRQIGLIFKDAAGLWEKDKMKPYIGMISNVALSILFVKKTGSILGVLIPTMCILLMIYYPWEIHILFKYLFKRRASEYILMAVRFSVSSIMSVFISYYAVSRITLFGISGIIVKGLVCTLVTSACYLLFNSTTIQLKETVQIGLRFLIKKDMK